MPISSPGSLRSSRKQALAIGAEPGKFVAEIPYNACAGAPMSVAGGCYQSLPVRVDSAAKAIDVDVPFVLSGR
jgi:hypothetical protein